MKFEKILKILREENCETQTDMADFLGIKQRSYQRYESGEREPDFDDLVRIALHFGVTTDYLLGLSEDPKKSKAHKAGTDPETIFDKTAE